jgi:outer membrane lipoprotein-sorting protein
MAAAILLTASFGAHLDDPIAAAQARFAQLDGYRAVLTSTSGDGTRERLRYYFKAPGYVRMEFLRPNRGALLLYDPFEKRARVWPFGSPGPSLALRPGNRLIRSAGGHRVDRSDVGILLENIRTLQDGGTTRVVELKPGETQGLVHLSIVGRAGHAVDGVRRYEVWLDPDLHFPVRVEGFDARDRILEAVTLSEIVLNPRLGEDFFRSP